MTWQNTAPVPWRFRTDDPNAQLGQLSDLIKNLVVVVKLHAYAVAEYQCGGIVHAIRFMHAGVNEIVHLPVG